MRELRLYFREVLLQREAVNRLVAKGNLRSQENIIFKMNESGVCLQTIGNGAIKKVSHSFR